MFASESEAETNKLTLLLLTKNSHSKVECVANLKLVLIDAG